MLSTAAGPLDADAVSGALADYDDITGDFVHLLNVVQAPLELVTMLGGFPAEMLVGIPLAALDQVLETLVFSAADLILGSPVPFPVDVTALPISAALDAAAADPPADPGELDNLLTLG